MLTVLVSQCYASYSGHAASGLTLVNLGGLYAFFDVVLFDNKKREKGCCMTQHPFRCYFFLRFITTTRMMTTPATAAPMMMNSVGSIPPGPGGGSTYSVTLRMTRSDTL